jgi:glycosyltransferase involved in cell wall biosynthesis
MEVAIDASRYFYKKPTGVEVFSQKLIPGLAESLNSRGFSIKLLVRPSQKEDVLRVFPDKSAVVGPEKFWTMYGLSKHFLRHSPDIFYSPSHTLPPVLPKKSFLNIHDIGFKEFPEVYKKAQRIYLDISSRFAFKNATGIFVDSFSVKNKISDFYNVKSSVMDKIHVTYPGFSREDFLGGFDFHDQLKQREALKKFNVQTKEYILVVGRVEQKKNFNTALKAFARISEKHKDLKIVFVGGRGYGFEEFQKILSDLKIKEKVVLTGYLLTEDLLTLYNNALVYYSPSLLEGFGFTALEAFCFNLPTVLSNNSSFPEVAGRGAILVNPVNIDENVEALDHCIVNPVSLEEVKYQQQSLSRFSWERCIGDVCNQIIA